MVAQGLATAVRERHSGRSRNRYQITDEGREALRNWLAEPSSPPRIEIEPCLRVLFADQGDHEDALRAIATLRSWAQDHIDSEIELVRQYQAGEAPFPDRLHIAALGARFISDYFHTITAFADFAETEIEKWPTTDELGLQSRGKAILDELAQRDDPARPHPPSAERGS